MTAPPHLSLIVGLGNPDVCYADSRHNLGFMLLDRLAAGCGVSWKHKKKCSGWMARLSEAGPWLLKPDTFVNDSGKAVRLALSWFDMKHDGMLVVHDELAFSPGVIRLKKGGGHGGHNGLKSIIDRIGVADFWRLRLGIGHPGERDRVSGYVLSRPPILEREQILASMQRVLDVFPQMIIRGPEFAQQQINQTNDTADDGRTGRAGKD